MEQHNAHVHEWYYIGRMLWLYRTVLKPLVAADACARHLARYRQGVVNDLARRNTVKAEWMGKLA